MGAIYSPPSVAPEDTCVSGPDMQVHMIDKDASEDYETNALCSEILKMHVRTHLARSFYRDTCAS